MNEKVISKSHSCYEENQVGELESDERATSDGIARKKPPERGNF
jgi:hypothetical protein